MLLHLTPECSLGLIVRPSQEMLPDLPLPFFPRSIGHFRLTAGVSEQVPAGEKPFAEFFWTVDGHGEVFRSGNWFRSGPGGCFYHLPGEEHVHRVADEGWEYRWIAFDGPMAAAFLESYGYPAEGFHAGVCPDELFLEVEKRLRVRSPFAWREMVALVARILACAGGTDAEDGDGIAERAASLCRERFSDPDLNVNALAELLQVERSTLLRHFRGKMRITPSEYLAQQRLQHALALLKQSRLPLSAIARASGFSDANYLCRVVRRHTGMSPAHYRTR